MNLRMRSLLGVLCLGAVLAGPTSALDGPDQLVRGLYDLKYGVNAPELADRFLAADAATAYMAQLAMDEPQDATGFDWRYDAQDLEITDLVIERRGDHAGDASGTTAVVNVRLMNFGEPVSLVYELCLARTGWRIADVRRGRMQDREPWTLRQLLAIPAEPVHC